MRAPDTACQPYAPDAAADRITTRLGQLTLGTEQQRAAASFAAANAARLRWLETAIATAEQREHSFRNTREEAEMLSMRRPLSTERVYTLFGLLLGTLPPAAIVLKLAFLLLLHGDGWSPFFVVLLFGVPMMLICSLVGRLMGRRLAPMLDRATRRRWLSTLLSALGAGFLWACATGAAGGAIVFLLGAFYGLACALPFGLAGFLLFAVCHRLLARGGMMDARHFWPIAYGITLAFAALILSPSLLPD